MSSTTEKWTCNVKECDNPVMPSSDSMLCSYHAPRCNHPGCTTRATITRQGYSYCGNHPYCHRTVYPLCHVCKGGQIIKDQDMRKQQQLFKLQQKLQPGSAMITTHPSARQ
jgi:hypothetical protein